MNNEELLEWLGLTLADLLVYLGLAAAGTMFLFTSPAVDASLAAIAILLSIIACPLGMKRNPKLSELTNVIKLISYPLCVGLIIAVVVAHYVIINLAFFK